MSETFESPLDQIIREARERGEFDDLPGKGKPLHWEDESQVPEDERLAHRLLKNNGYTLDWIELARELDAAYDQLRAALSRARRLRAEGELDAAGWFAALDQYQDKIRALNRRVIGYNVRAPNEKLYKRPYPVEVD